MKIIGHRGAKAEAPENTLASIQAALSAGCDEIEIDVRLTQDNIVVLMHDAHLGRLAATHAAIASSTYAELQKLKPDLPTLEQAIATVNKRVPLLIEVKSSAACQPLIDIITQCLSQGYRSQDFLFASFSQSILKELHAALPSIETVVNESWSGVRASRRAKQLGTNRLSMNQRWLWRGFISPMAKRGYHLAAYALNDSNKAKRWASYGLYAAITDVPSLLKKEVK